MRTKKPSDEEFTLAMLKKAEEILKAHVPEKATEDKQRKEDELHQKCISVLAIVFLIAALVLAANIEHLPVIG